MGEEPRRAFGADRIETGEGGEIWVVCPNPKAWLPRQEKTLTRSEYPGTAIDWMGGVFEVLRAETLPDGGMRYRLAPWEDAHTIRRMERYDADSETARAAESIDVRVRVRNRGLSILLAPLAGFLPGAAQKEMENEFGASAVAMTISSALPLAAVGFLGVFAHFLGAIGGGLGFAVWISPPFPIALYLFAESTLRLASAVAMSEPMGSLPVVVAWQVWREACEPDREALADAAPPPDVDRDAMDRFQMLEPLLSLLPVPDQQVLASRFDFDALRWGRVTAGVLLLVGGFNAFASLTNVWAPRFTATDALWLLIGAFLVLEQVGRWKKLKAGQPAGSVLGILVRPLARPLLDPGAPPAKSP